MSNKTEAAIAAEVKEQPAAITEAADQTPAEQPAEPITLSEIEALALPGDLPETEAPRRFTITDDGCADWAIQRIKTERAEYERLRDLAEKQIAAINEKVEAAKRRAEQNTQYLTYCLSEFFETVPHKTTKTTEKYRLLSGTLTKKLGGTKLTPDNAKLVAWLKANGHEDDINVEETPKWGDLKKRLATVGEIVTLADTGEIIEGVTAIETPDTFIVE